MSRDWDDDDEARPRRRRRYEEDDFDERPRRRRSGGGVRSGGVTGVGVITIILGSLLLLCGMCYSIIGLAAGAGGMGGGPQLFPVQLVGGILIVIAVVILVFGALYLAGGIGCVQRRNWGRIMTLIMAGFSGVFGILAVIGIVGTLLQPNIGGPPGFQEGRILGVFIQVIFVLVLFTHCIMSFVVLLNADNTAEFE